MTYTWKLKPEAVKILRRVKRHFLQAPARLNMNHWVTDSNKAPCGTAMCIGGAICYLLLPDSKRKHVRKAKGTETKHRALLGKKAIDKAAAKALGLREDKVLPLFHVASVWRAAWPEQFRRRFVSARGAKRRAQVTAERIEHFIQTGE